MAKARTTQYPVTSEDADKASALSTRPLRYWRAHLPAEQARCTSPEPARGLQSTAIMRNTLLFSTLMLAGCGANDHGDGGHGLDATGADSMLADATPGCTPTAVTVEEATRTVDVADVTVKATLENAFTHCAKAEVAIKLVLDTHAVDLLAIDVAGGAVLETSRGAVVSDGFSWAPGDESSHHRDGVLSVPAPPLGDAAWLRLTIPGVGGVDRVFEWDDAFLAHDLP